MRKLSANLRKGKFFLPLLLCIPLAGCSLADIMTGVPTDYHFNRNEDDQESSDYLQTVLDERIKEKTKTLEEDPETRVRQESYIEETTRLDLLKALHAKGYYNATVSLIQGAEPLSGQYKIHYGQKFQIGSVKVSPSQFSNHLNDDNIQSGMPLDAEAVLSAQSVLSNRIQKDNCYFNLDVRNEVYLNKTADTGQVNFLVDATEEGYFGKAEFTGNETVKERYLKKLVPWKEGDCFRREKIEAYKSSLLQTGLFAKADIILPEQPEKDGNIPITVSLKERAHRSISAGLTYYSDEGPGLLLGWEHRNFLGSAEKLKADLSVSSLKQSLGAEFTRPYFMRMDQTLSITSSLQRQSTDAYDELGVNFGSSINKNFTKNLSASTGVEFSLTRIDDNVDNSTDTFGLLSAPQILSYDTRDNKLDPRKGWNITASAEPFFDLFGESDPFFKTQFSGSGYLAVTEDSDTLLAAKAGLGSIWGADQSNVPATERFYAGGSGSVRGYGYQEVGPQENGDPTGGLSIATFSLELRSKFTDKIGGVVFIDAASVTENNMPEFSNLAIGTGVGLRYYTGFGPVRLDIATPLTQKDNLDQNYQFYVSIGQAF